MTKRLTMTLVALAIFVLLAVLPVSAATANASRIANGAQVLVGESGLNLTAALKTPGYLGAYQIAWFPSTAQLTATVPEKIIDVTATYGSFYINPADFATRTGNWYCWTSQPAQDVQSSGLAFIVADPAIEVKIWDIDQNLDVTGKSVPTGQRLTFRIDTNTYPVASNAMRPWILLPSWRGTSLAGDLVNGSFYGFIPDTGAVIAQTKEGFFDIKVKTDQGNTLAMLYNGSIDTVPNKATTKPIPLTGLWVNNQPWYWGNFTNNTGADIATVQGTNWPSLTNAKYINFSLFWATGALDEIGQKIYPAGTYTVTAELTMNAIKDNYKNAGADYAGKTISEARTITIVSDTVKIEANKDTVTRSKPFSVTVTGKPSTYYWVFLKGVSQMSGMYDNQPPIIPPFQSGVYNDTPTPPAGGGKLYGDKFVPQNAAKTVDQFAAGYNNALVGAPGGPPAGGYPNNGTGYYVMIKTADTGVRVIEFMTSNQTKAQKYTIRVENLTTGATPTYKTDEVDVKVEKGTVTITAAGDGSYYLGEEVKFTGTNTETVKTYLFITGPNLKTDGSRIDVTDPRTTPATTNNVGTFKVVDVASDNTWSYKWPTATVALDAGTYTVYAVSSPNNRADLADTAYGTVSIIIKKPFVSATVSQATVARGDAIFVRGTAEGKPSPGVQMWVLGKNYPTTIADIKTATVNADASFSFEIKDTTTKNLAAGQYFVVVQHPMQNDQFDIVAAAGLGAANTIGVFNVQLGGVAPGVQVFTLLGTGSLQGSDAAEALVQAINDPNVDDTYTKLQFLIEEPVIRVDAIGDRHVGDKFTITAQTNFAVDDEILVEVYSSSFKPTQKSQSGEFSGATGTVKVTKGDSGMNKISFDVDASTFKPDEYIVKMTAVIQTTTGTALFNVLEGAAPTAVPTAVATTVVPATAAPTAPPTAAATPTKTPTQPGFGALVALIGLGAVAFLVVRKH